jgi:hypothetical protein
MAGFNMVHLLRNYRSLPVCSAAIVLLMCAGAHADEQDRHCRAVAAGAAAELKAAAAEPMSAVALSAARDGAYLGCMSAAPARTSAASAANAEDPAASEPESRVASQQTTDRGGLFDFLTREPVRTEGHKRLQKRGH